MELSVAYGAAFFAEPFARRPQLFSQGVASNTAPTALTTTAAAETAAPTNTTERRADIYAINIEIGRDDAHLLCVFIAVLILTLLLSSRR